MGSYVASILEIIWIFSYKSAFNNNNKKKIQRLGRLVLWCHTETSLHEEDI